MSATYVAFLSLAGLVLLKLGINLFKRARSPLSAVPGPWYTRWTDLVLLYYWLRGKRAQYVEGLHQKYGKIVRIAPGEVDCSSINASKQIHSFSRPFRKLPRFYNCFTGANRVYGVFSTPDPGFHGWRRRLLAGPLAETPLKKVEHVVRAKAELAVQRIGMEMKSGVAADVMKWWLFYSTDVIGELTFGDSFRMLEQGRMNQYVTDLTKISKRASIRIAFPTFIKFAFYLPLPVFRDAVAALHRLRSYSEESIVRYEKMLAADPWNPKPTLFTKLYKAGENGLDRDALMIEAQSYIVAGSDTTAHTMTYLAWAVCRNENIKRRLVEEVEKLPEGYSDDDLKTLPYLNQVIQETLRLYTAVPGALPREVPSGGCEVDGYWMPSGTAVCTQAWSFHRDPVLFPDPEIFNPSRWENPTKEMKDSYMPFGAGPRICLGLHLAYMELRHATAKFFRTFPDAKVSDLEGFSDDDMEQVPFFLMYPKGKRCLVQAS